MEGQVDYRQRLRRGSAAGAAATAAAAAAAANDSDRAEIEAASASAGSDSASVSAAASVAPHARGRSISLLSALAGDSSLQRLQPMRLATLRSAVDSLQDAIHSETVAHALTLYRYVRLQQKLMMVRRYKRNAAARKLNKWIAAAYNQQWPELLVRIKHDAHRLFDVFSEPAEEDEWWPQLLEEIAAAGGRAKYLLLALLTLDRHHAAIRESYYKADRLQLMRYYLLKQQWSGRQIEEDLRQDGIIQAALESSSPSPSLLPHSSPPQQVLQPPDEKQADASPEDQLTPAIRSTSSEKPPSQASFDGGGRAGAAARKRKRVSSADAAAAAASAASSSSPLPPPWDDETSMHHGKCSDTDEHKEPPLSLQLSPSLPLPLQQHLDGAVAMELDGEQPAMELATRDADAAEGKKNLQQQQQEESGSALRLSQQSLSQGSRRRTYPDPPMSQHPLEQQPLEQQLKRCQQQIQQMVEEHTVALLQQQTEAEERAAAAAESTRRIEELVRWLEQTHVDHVSRVSDPQGMGAVPDATADVLREMAALQAELSAPSGGRPHFYNVTPDMVEQWVADLEVLETALAAPHTASPYAVSAAEAQTVVDHLRSMWTELEEAPEGGLPFMRVLLLAKKLRCIDQLRPACEEVEGGPAIPWQVLELRALLVQVASHDHMWAYLLRWPFSYFETGRWKLTDRAASHYARAAEVASLDVCQQARLRVEQCKVLERAGRLCEVPHLDAAALHYPDAPLQLLHELHTKYAPAPGPPLDRDMLQLFEARSSWSEDDWNEECAAAEAHAAELEKQLQLDMATGTSATTMSIDEQQQQAEQARRDANILAARPRSFAAAMNKSLRFFHSDKRTGGADEDAEFARVKEAWYQLNACRTYFQQLRAFQEQAAAAAMEQ